MNLSRFFEHWQIEEHPFRGEEARQDPVFLRLEERMRRASASAGRAASTRSGKKARPAADTESDTAVHSSSNDATTTSSSTTSQQHSIGAVHASHSDFEKITGEFNRPSTSIVFGEKGSGKTAIRLQMVQRADDYNQRHPDARVLLVEYDDLNPVLDRFVARVAGEGRRDDVAKALKKLTLSDHIDAVLGRVVPRLVDGLLGENDSGSSVSFSDQQRRAARRIDASLRRDLLLLQAVYDQGDHAAERTGRLRRTLRLKRGGAHLLWNILAFAGWILPIGAIVGFGWAGGWKYNNFELVVLGLAILIWAVGLTKVFGVDRARDFTLGKKIRRQILVSPRTAGTYAKSLQHLEPAQLGPSSIPSTNSVEARYAMLDRAIRVLRSLGFVGLLVVVDRVDEPSIIQGDTEKMRLVVWPMLDAKFLQADGLGVKMLLPIELRHALFRESNAFFQQARLDKQNLIERLTWTGAMLFDLCNARLHACRSPDADPITLLDLFESDVTRQDLVDALDQMHQPRDAFKLLYQCLVEHCSNVTEDQAQWRIPRLVLENVRKQQSERLRQLELGVRPA